MLAVYKLKLSCVFSMSGQHLKESDHQDSCCLRNLFLLAMLIILFSVMGHTNLV